MIINLSETSCRTWSQAQFEAARELAKEGWVRDHIPPEVDPEISSEDLFKLANEVAIKMLKLGNVDGAIIQGEPGLSFNIISLLLGKIPCYYVCSREEKFIQFREY